MVNEKYAVIICLAYLHIPSNAEHKLLLDPLQIISFVTMAIIF